MSVKELVLKYHRDDSTIVMTPEMLMRQQKERRLLEAKELKIAKEKLSKYRGAMTLQDEAFCKVSADKEYERMAIQQAKEILAGYSAQSGRFQDVAFERAKLHRHYDEQASRQVRNELTGYRGPLSLLEEAALKVSAEKEYQRQASIEARKLHATYHDSLSTNNEDSTMEENSNDITHKNHRHTTFLADQDEHKLITEIASVNSIRLEWKEKVQQYSNPLNGCRVYDHAQMLRNNDQKVIASLKRQLEDEKVIRQRVEMLLVEAQNEITNLKRILDAHFQSETGGHWLRRGDDESASESSENNDSLQ